MAVVRNITKDALVLSLPGFPTVGPNKEAEIPDADFVDRAWPTSTWKLVKKPSGKGVTDVSTDDALVFSTSETTPDEETE